MKSLLKNSWFCVTLASLSLLVMIVGIIMTGHGLILLGIPGTYISTGFVLYIFANGFQKWSLDKLSKSWLETVENNKNTKERK